MIYRSIVDLQKAVRCTKIWKGNRNWKSAEVMPVTIM